MTPSVRRARAAFLRACELDVAVRKPGNVSVESPGHGMHAAQFVASAQAAAGALFEPGALVGARIEGAVGATLAAAGCNTNLGIVLLCAPIAMAAQALPAAPGAAALRAALEEVLAALDIDDARRAYQAIALARPAGLGRAPREDVHGAPSVGLAAAMALAADRDSIARQYRDGYAELFERALPACGLPPHGAAAVQRVYLGFLARVPDSHVVRKHGSELAHHVMHEAKAWSERAESGAALDADPAFAAWDESLKARRVNPGTSADLTVATLMLAGIAT